jgi:hypothetical protein
LRPAGYDLRVGSNYAIAGELHTLNEGGSLTIKPYQVAVIQTLETLNLPDFLIGRWNIRVKFAYKGLLWAITDLPYLNVLGLKIAKGPRTAPIVLCCCDANCIRGC